MGVCSTRLTLSDLVFAGQNWSTLRLTGGIRKLSGILAAFGGHVALMGGSAGVLGLVDRPQVRELVSAARRGTGAAGNRRPRRGRLVSSRQPSYPADEILGAGSFSRGFE
jgi:hypothetical protein